MFSKKGNEEEKKAGGKEEEQKDKKPADVFGKKDNKDALAKKEPEVKLSKVQQMELEEKTMDGLLKGFLERMHSQDIGF